MEKKLVTLAEFNDSREKLCTLRDEPILNGIECPECGDELYDSSPNEIICTYPARKKIHCNKCWYVGSRVE